MAPSSWSLPLPSVCCQALGPELREVDAPRQGHSQGVSSVPTSVRTSLCRAPRHHPCMGGEAHIWGLASAPCPGVGLAGPGEGRDRTRGGVHAVGSNTSFLQTCSVTSGRSLHISEPQFLPLEPLLPCKGWWDPYEIPHVSVHENSQHRKCLKNADLLGVRVVAHKLPGTIAWGGDVLRCPGCGG